MITPYWRCEFPQDMTREEMLAELQRCDPNGCWTDKAADDEGMEPMTLEEALFHYGRMIGAGITGDAF
jgi:hypothetical protein